VLGLGIWAWSVARTAVFEDWQNWAFDRQMRGENATVHAYATWRISEGREWAHSWLKIPEGPQSPPPPRPVAMATEPRLPSLEKNGLVGRLRVPRLHLSGMVREGTSEDTLGLSLGHVPSTALPGQNGNVAVAGHRDTLFRGLGGIHPNDLVLFETPGGKYVYQVEATQIVKPEDVSVLKAGDHSELTLITCYPFYYVGSAPDRFIVKARQVSEDLENTTVQAHPEPRHSDPAPVETAAAQPPVETPVEAPPPVRHSERKVPNDFTTRRVPFSLSANHSRELAPGISIGLTRTDAADHLADGWMWVMPDRKTIWLRRQRAHEPLVFYGGQDGRRRELVITAVTRNSISGYLMLPPVTYAKARVR
jgi:sortase A